MVIFDHDINAILVEPLKSCSPQELSCANEVLHTHLCDHGLCPLFHILNNECPASLKRFMHQVGIAFQLVPPHLHRTNAAERAIQNFKDNLVTGISSCDPSFPLRLWDCLLQQDTLTLNLLRPSQINLRLSAKAQLNGAFDFN